MYYRITENSFDNEEQARAEIAARGWFAMAKVVSAETELHWHDFDVVAYVLEGPASAELGDARIVTANTGAKVEAGAGLVHRNVGPDARVLLGFSTDPKRFTMPIDKPLSALPA
jgi:hypothetical protein